MKTSKKVLSVLLSVLMISLTLSCLSAGFTVGALEATGECGDNVTWSFDSSSGALTVSGSGDMWDYSSTGSPFYNKSEIKSVAIGSGVTNIGKYAFNSCKNLASLTIPSTVNVIKSYAFQYGKGLKSVTIPSGVKKIESYAFYECGLTSLTLSVGLEEIGLCAFGSCKLTGVTIPASVTKIDPEAFAFCQITTYTVAAENRTYTSDENGCLYNKAKTELLRYPAGNSRSTFTVPAGVTKIGNDAFYNCYFLTSVTIPAGVTDIHSNNAFYGASSLEFIAVDAGNPNYASDASGCLYDKAKTTLIAYPIGSSRTSFRIPTGVTTIGGYAFFKAKITAVIIPTSVTTIQSDAFWCSLNLNDVYYAGSATQWENDVSIGGYNGYLTDASFHYNYVGPSYTVTLIADEGGTVSGDGTYEEDTYVTITAAPNSGYHFIGWYEGDTIVSGSTSYDLTVTQDVTLTAKFEKDAPVSYAVTVSANPAEGGTVSGGGTFTKGTLVTVQANPNLFSEFNGWYEDGVKVSNNPIYSFTVTKDTTLSAGFRIVKAKLTLTTEGKGSVIGGGVYQITTPVQISATASSGWHFVGWYNGELLVSANASYQYPLFTDTTLTAKFEKDAAPDPGQPENPGGENNQPADNHCPWCGGVHEGFFQKIIGFFHNILARIFGKKY